MSCARVLHKNACFMENATYFSDIPQLRDDAVHVWQIRVSDVLERINLLHAVLCDKEQAKAARFYHDADRHSSIAARGALRLLLSAYSGIPSQDIQFDYSETGKPFLVSTGAGKSLGFNVSHSGEWVVVAVGQKRSVGVDVEQIRRKVDVMEIASRYFTPEETARIKRSDDLHAHFFHYWSRKEAYIKAAGSALFRELSTFSVPDEDGEKDGWFFYRLEAGPQYASALVSDQVISTLLCFDFCAMWG